MTATDENITEIGYVDALAELEAILEELDDDSMDIDVLSDRVERAAELIKICRSRIVLARDKVSSIVSELDEVSSPSTPTNGDSPE